jgi:ATP-binding cassette subfamily B protein
MKTWQMLLRLLRYRPWLAVTATVSWVLISLVPVGLGLTARAFFDALSRAGTGLAAPELWWLVLLPVVLQAGRLLVTWVTIPLNVLQRFSVAALLSRNLFAHILSRPGASALDGTPGEAISRFRDDVDEVSTFLSIMQLLSGIGECLTVTVIIGLMLRVNAFVTVAAVLPLLVVVLLARAAGKRINRYRTRSRDAAGKVTSALAEIFGMVQAVKLAGAERQVTEHLHTLGERRRAETVKDTLFSELLRSIFFNTANLATGLVLLMAAGSMRAGTFTVGDFALFAAYVGRITLFTGVVGDLLARYKQVGVSLERMHALMPGAPTALLVAHAPICLDGDLPPVFHPVLSQCDMLSSLEARNLTYLYPATGRGIRGVDLYLSRGSLTVITGRVGAGKTTLLRTMLGLLPLQAGELRWNGRRVADPAGHFQPPRSSYTPQVPVLFSSTLKENMLLGMPDDPLTLDRAIHAAVLDRDVSGLQQGLETPVGARGVKLSGGQVQRAAAARMFVRDTELLVVDDLSSSLDGETEQLLWERLRGRTGSTCMAASHRRAALEAADQIIVLKHGRVEAAGTLPQLLAESAEFREIWSGNVGA